MNQKARTKPATGPTPTNQNTTGQIKPKTQRPPRRAPTNPRAANYPDELHDFLDSVETPEQLKKEWGELQQAKATAEAAGDRLGANAATTALDGLRYKAGSMGLSGKDLPGTDSRPAEILGAFLGGGRGGGVRRRTAPPAQGQAKTAQGSSGGYVPILRAPPAKPRCFGGAQTKKKPKEYDEQLKQQEDALNNMTVEEYLQNRDRWDKMKRAGTEAQQAQDRAKAIADMASKNSDALRRANPGMSRADAASQGMAQAQSTAKNMDVLHSPDLSAGGSATGTTGLGDKSVNRSIGSNWGQNQDANGVGERVRAMDDAANKVPPSERASTKMNVKLERCP